MPAINLEQLNSQILGLENEITQNLKNKLDENIRINGLSNYTIVWKQFQNVCIPELKNILNTHFVGAEVIEELKKSVFPDLKMIYNGYKIAFDIKTSNNAKDPEYDNGRLDTIHKERLNKFAEEYDVVIKYSRDPPSIIKVYFEPMRHTVGKNKNSGIKHRKYSGHIRPKSWEDFDNNIKHWETKEIFLSKIKETNIPRYRSLLKDFIPALEYQEKRELYLSLVSDIIPTLNDQEKEEFRRLFV